MTAHGPVKGHIDLGFRDGTGEVVVVEEAGHIPGAYNVPIAFAGATGMSTNHAFSDAIERLFEKDKKIVFT